MGLSAAYFSMSLGITASQREFAAGTGRKPQASAIVTLVNRLLMNQSPTTTRSTAIQRAGASSDGAEYTLRDIARSFRICVAVPFITSPSSHQDFARRAPDAGAHVVEGTGQDEAAIRHGARHLRGERCGSRFILHDAVYRRAPRTLTDPSRTTFAHPGNQRGAWPGCEVPSLRRRKPAAVDALNLAQCAAERDAVRFHQRRKQRQEHEPRDLHDIRCRRHRKARERRRLRFAAHARPAWWNHEHAPPVGGHGTSYQQRRESL